MIYFLLQDLPQKHPEHENPDNEDPALQEISELYFLQYVHQDRTKKKNESKEFFSG